MSWWNPRSKPNDEPERIHATGAPGEIISCDNPETAIIIPPPDPEPNLSTKPKDVVGYCFGFACPKKHVDQPFESISIDGYRERRICQTCGEVSKPAAVKRIAEARWVDRHKFLLSFGPEWVWRHNHLVSGFSPANLTPQWSRHEFVHYLETPKRRKK